MTKPTTTAPATPNFKNVLTELENALEKYSKQVPSLPVSAKEAIVKYSPYLSLLVIVITLPAVLTALGLGALFAPFAYMAGVRYGAAFSLGSIFLLLSIVVEGLAIPGLFARKLSAWRLVFYGTLLAALDNLLAFNLGSLLIGTLISWYILFQVKSYYR